MPTYNTGTILAGCIESILNQTYKNIELLITDDKSDDEVTLAILGKYEKEDSRVKVFRLKENDGAGTARNNSIANAAGQYIAFCDSDDRWVTDKIEKQVAFLKEKDCCLAFSSYYLCDKEGKDIGIVKAPDIVSLSMLKRDNKIGCLTAIYDTTKYGKFYLPTIRKRQDWAMFLNILMKCGCAYGIAEPLAYYGKFGDSLSRKKTSLVKYNISVYRKVLGFSAAKAVLFFLFVFMPSYSAKVAKVKIDSYRYLREKRRAARQTR